MSRLQTVIEQYAPTIETERIFRPQGGRSLVPIPFTLHFQGRSLQDAMETEQTITPTQALTTLFILSDAGRTDPAFHRMSKQKEKALKKLLGPLYETFWQAFQEDEAEALRGQFLEVRPDPEGADEQSDDGLNGPLYSQDLSFGKRVVYFDSLNFPKVYVGRVEEVKQAHPEETLQTGLMAEVVLLQTDGHEQMADLFVQRCLSRNPEPPVPGVYTWPKNLPPQSFQKPKRPGHLVSLQVKLPYLIEIIVVSSADLEED